MIRKIGAAIILVLLLVVPFFNWRLGAVLWMCAWLTYVCQGLFKGKQLDEYNNADEDDENDMDDEE